MRIILKAHPHYSGPASPEQAEAGNYRKRKIDWNGLSIAIENEAGSVRRGVNKKTGEEWQQRMPYPYGYIKRTVGVDGDQVDVFLGPHLDAPMVYVVHQRRWGDWKNYDEDKCMIGFSSEDEAKAAFLASYSDPRFLGPVTAMPVAAFVAKARATADAPAMIKALLFKSRVDPYVRNGRVVHGYDNHRRAHTAAAAEQLQLVFQGEGRKPVAVVPEPDKVVAPPPEPLSQIAPADGEVKKFYVTMIRDPGPHQRVAFLAGPFDTHEESLVHVDAARRKAEEVDARSAFDAFGTSGLTLPEGKHPAGKLNSHLGIGKKEPEVMDFETFASRNGGSRQDYGDAGLHRNPNAQSPKVWGKKVLIQRKKDDSHAAHRAELQKQYDAKVAAGELRAPTVNEEMIRTARGHDDNPSVQAARRVLVKRGIEWRAPAA